MKIQCLSLPIAATVVASAVIVVLSAMALRAAAAVVEHTFVVSEMNMTHLYKEMLVTVVNGQFPGPMIEVTEGDSVVVHVVNKSPRNITIHWHGVKQQLNCWADGVPMITQSPILRNQNFTYRFNVTGQEGTLWWHAHVTCLRATLHGAFIIRPRDGASSYPFPNPDKDVPIIIGEWWEMDLDELDSFFDDNPSGATMNGKFGDLYNCSGAKKDGYVLNVEPGKTYLLRIINAVLVSEYYLKIAGHKFTVVATDANYVNPYTTDIIAIAPGETIDALVVADAPPGGYYITALESPKGPPPIARIPKFVTRGTVWYSTGHVSSNGTAPPVATEMPDQHDTMPSFYFHGNLTSLNDTQRPLVPERADESLFITVGLGSICRRGQSCKRSGSKESIIVATMNNISFQLPDTTMPLLEAHYYHTGDMDVLQELPDRLPMVFNFTDRGLIPWGPKEGQLEPTSRGSLARRFRHGAVVDIVFQGTAVMQSDSNPMHLHGHDMFVLAQGIGNYDAARDVAKYNLVDPPVRNSVLVPRIGWAAIRFVAENPGAYRISMSSSTCDMVLCM
ncbi:laccase-15-like [Setaria viridis]|uniref:laccase-15-like n=1 Tax=Setaria viridis TaxID=4556 RepID=UPI003B3B145E